MSENKPRYSIIEQQNQREVRKLQLVENLWQMLIATVSSDEFVNLEPDPRADYVVTLRECIDRFNEAEQIISEGSNNEC